MKLSAKSAAALVALGLVAIVAASGVAYWRMRPESLPAQVVYGSGRIEADEVRVPPEVGGRLVDMRAVEGATLRVGEPLARIDAADFALGRIVATTLDNIETFARGQPQNLVVPSGMAGANGETPP